MSEEQKLVLDINSKSDFEQKLIDAGNKIIVVEFYASWCGPCKMIAPKLEELAHEYLDKALVLKVDVDDLEEIAVEYNVTSMPTFMFLKNKKQLETIIGSKAGKQLVTMLAKYCGETPRGKDDKSGTDDNDDKSAKA